MENFLYGKYKNLSGRSGLSGNEGIIYDFLLAKGATPQGAAAVLGNWYWESGWAPNNLENGSNSKGGVSDDEFTDMVNNGTISKEEFISSKRFGLYSKAGVEDGYGYGLGQWTALERKNALYDFAQDYATQHNKEFDIADINMQLEFFWTEITESYYATAYEAIMTETDVESATRSFMYNFEGIHTEEGSSGAKARVEKAGKMYELYLANHIIGGDGTIVAEAIEIHRHLRTNGFVYSMDWTKSVPAVDNYIDCSSYVTWVLIECGVDGFYPRNGSVVFMGFLC